MALSVRENDYVRAADYMGVSRFRTIVRHIVPKETSGSFTPSSTKTVPKPASRPAKYFAE